MISDTLYDAIEEIRLFQREHPDIYNEDRTYIDTAITQMEELRDYFDAIPKPEDETINLDNDDE